MKAIQFRSQLSAPGLYKLLYNYFSQHVEDPRTDNGNIKIKAPSALMSTIGLFALQYCACSHFLMGICANYLMVLPEYKCILFII